MYIPFDQMGPGARIWIYQAEKPFDPRQTETIDRKLKHFLEDWKAHGTPLRCSYAILHGQFIVMAVDEKDQQATGCSIDDSVGIIAHLEQELSESLLDRSKVPFMLDGRIEMVDFKRIRDLIANGVIRGDTKTFNTAAKNKRELDTGWLIHADKSWISRYFS